MSAPNPRHAGMVGEYVGPDVRMAYSIARAGGGGAGMGFDW